MLEVGQAMGAGSCQTEISVACFILGSRPPCGREDRGSLWSRSEVKFMPWLL